MPPADDRVRALYREPPEGFIAARDALVKELKAAGRSDEAAAVKALRKPTVPAWAVDQLAGRDPDGIQALMDAGAEVRAAQQAAMSSAKGADRLRDATAERRRVVAELARSAGEVLSASGRTPEPHLEEIRTTLEQASVDDEVGERVRTGTLDRPARGTAGLGDLFGLRAVPGDGEAAEPPTVAADEGEERAVSASERARLRRDADATARLARRAREVADRFAGQLTDAERRLQEVAEKHAGAEAKALAAELEAKRAAEAAEAAARRS